MSGWDVVYLFSAAAFLFSSEILEEVWNIVSTSWSAALLARLLQEDGDAQV